MRLRRAAAVEGRHERDALLKYRARNSSRGTDVISWPPGEPSINQYFARQG
jgi:hypothetical protein